MPILYKKQVKALKPKQTLFSKGVFYTLDKETTEQIRAVLKFAQNTAEQHGRMTINSKDIEQAYKEYFQSHAYDYLTMLGNVTQEFIETKKKGSERKCK